MKSFNIEFLSCLLIVGVIPLLLLSTESRSQDKMIQLLHRQLQKGDLRNYRQVFISLDSCTYLLPLAQREKIIQKTLEIAQATQKQQIIILAKTYHCQFKVEKGDNSKRMVEEFFLLLKQASERGYDYEIAFIYSKISSLFGIIENDSRRIFYAEESIKHFEKINHFEELASNYLNISLAYYRIEKFRQSEVYLKKALNSKSYAFLPKKRKINLLNTLGLCYFKMDKPDLSLFYFNEAESVAESSRDTTWMGIIQGNLGQLLGSQQQYDSAQKLLAYDIRISLERGEKANAIKSLVHSGEFFLEENKVQEAEAAFQNARLQLQQIDLKHNQEFYEIHISLYKGQVRCAQKKQELKKAIAYQDSVIFFQDSLTHYLELNELRKDEELYKMSMLEDQVSELKLENKFQKFELNRNSYLLFGLIIFILFITSLLILIYVAAQQRKKVNAELQLSNITVQQQKLEIEVQHKAIGDQNKALQKQNESLNQQKKENMRQRDFINFQNIELKETNETLQVREKELREALDKIRKNKVLITQQNARLKNYNSNLEKWVKIRTEELSKKNLELVDYNQQLEQFNFITAHNLRAPIANILGLSHIILEDFKLEDHIKLFVDKIALSARQLDQVIIDLNEILEIKKSILKISEEIHLGNITRRTLEMLDSVIKSSKGQINYDYAAFSKLSSVAIYWESILYNLISNALKYRDKNRPPQINLRTCIENDQAVLIVEDNGLGIDLERFGKDIFGLYKRFHPEMGGKGLGLHLVKLQIESMGGNISVKSKVGEGTTFYLKIPRDKINV